MDNYKNVYLKKVNSILLSHPYFETFNSKDIILNVMEEYSKIIIEDDWLDVIEDVIPSLVIIVNNPRRFISMEEDVINVSLAKGFSKESIKHLSINSNLISGISGDMVIPSKILNTYKEDSIEIYENRFIYTLLLMLYEFVNTNYSCLESEMSKEKSIKLLCKKRMGNINYENTMIVKIPLYEVYKNDDILVNKYQRLGRVNNIVNRLLNSMFAQQMKNSLLVKPPIVKTNILKNDIHFKNALHLWNFLFTYQGRGYKIEYVSQTSSSYDENKSDFNSVMFLNYLIYSNDYNKQEEDLKTFLCVIPLEIYLLEKQKEIKLFENTMEDNFTKSLVKLKSNKFKDRLKIVYGCHLANKYNELELSMTSQLISLINELNSDELEGNLKEDVRTKYLERIRSLLQESHKKINSYVFSYGKG